MKPDPLDDLLRDYALQALPPAPSDLTLRVRQEIDERRGRSFWTRVVPLLEWREIFTEPRLAIPAFACALAIGILPPFLSAKAHAEERLARASIHLNAFSTQAAGRFNRLVSDRTSTARPAQP